MKAYSCSFGGFFILMKGGDKVSARQGKVV
jgi:hypothetical protein